MHPLLRSGVILTLFCGFLQAQTAYYIDAMEGSDTNSGQTPQTAWRSFSPCNTHIFQAGDSLLFKRGGSWTGNLRPQGSGTIDHPIVISAYGIGDRPVLDAAGKIAAGQTVSATIQFFNQPHWTIRDLKIMNFMAAEPDRFITVSDRQVPVKSPKIGILVQACDYGTIQGLRFINLEICRVNGDMSTKHNGGIFFDITRDSDRRKWIPTNFENLIIEQCHIYDVDRTGISNRSVWEARSLHSATGDTLTDGRIDNWFPSRSVHIRSNRFERTGANALILRVAKRPVIEKNLFANCAIKGSGNAVFPFNCDDALIQYNEACYTRYNDETNAWDGRADNDAGGFDSDYNCKNTIIQYNYSHDNEYGGILICCMGGGTRFNAGTIVRYNIFQNNQHHVFRVSGQPVDTYIYNNIIYVDSTQQKTALVWHKNWRGYPDSTHYFNNVFINQGKLSSYRLERSSNNVFSHNVFYGITADNEPDDPNKLILDPQLENPGKGGNGLETLSGYKSKSGSPLKGSGYTLPDHVSHDFWGTLISPFRKTDRGVTTFNDFRDEQQAAQYAKNYSVGFRADVSYLGPDRSEKLDLYFPQNAAANELFPAVVMIHGGGWVGGDKARKREKNIGEILASHGYVCASINYKLIDESPVWKQTISDCKNAIRFLRDQADELRINAEKIGVIGGSAGGYLSLMLGLTGPAAGLEGDIRYPGLSSRVQAVVDMYGAVDLFNRQETDPDGTPNGKIKEGNTVRFLGGTRDEIPEIWKTASPLTQISADDPPVLILHGLRDTTVDYNQSIVLADHLSRAGVQNHLYLLEDLGHTFSLQYDVNNKELKQDLSILVLDFFNHFLK